MSLFDIIQKAGKIVSIVGMSKNAGKTVVLNRLIQDSLETDIVLGITSTGRDGEEEDVVTNTKKPLIFVPKGTIITTTDHVFDTGDAKLEIIHTTDYTTPMGYVIIARVIEEGNIQIAGPQTNAQLKTISELMLKFGAQLVLIDGSINRIASASVDVSEAAILASGAVLSRSMDRVITETVHTVNLMQLDEVDSKIKSLVESDNNKVTFIDKDLRINYLNIKTAINCGNTIASNIKNNTLYVILPGSLTNKTAADIIDNTKNKDVIVVVKDGTKIFVDANKWMQLRRKGLKVKVLNKINVKAVTLNPYSPKGYYFNPKEFLSKMRARIKDIPVIDVIIEEMSQQSCGGEVN